MTTEHRVAFNPTDTPVVIDPEGRTVGGRSWGAVRTNAKAVEAALEGGRLLLVADEDLGGDDVHPEALEALRAVETARADDTPTPAKVKAAAKSPGGTVE